ncbi:MAG: CotH kinase family protein [Firmicutes bacterium]|nr:CotH kinase family protein [Bacillota bacterium]MCM1400534.1 CotH kinase family protein [Bacteroides sp.]MCM1476438.1 CotH kinase family protein [Bacteroides sp.]
MLKKLLICIALLSGTGGVFAQDTSVPHPGRNDVPVTGTLPVMYINTENSVPVTQKETYVQATYWIDCKGSSKYESVGSEAAPLALEIRGRGNASWTYDKKPYKIKLGKKTSILGLPKQKHFALLNHAPAQEGLAEAICFELGRRIGLAWTPGIVPVEVVLNSYNIGIYYLTESVKIDSNRINIYEQPDENTDETTVDGGWLVEIDNYDDPCQVKITQDPSGIAFQKGFTYKTPEVLSGIQETWLINELTTITNLLYDEDKTDNTWLEMIDGPELARYYIVQELTCNLDAFVGSTYMYKDLGGKWMFGPLWDSGWTFNSSPRTGTLYEEREKLCEGVEGCDPQYLGITWIKEMWKFPAFREMVMEEWKKFYPDKVSTMADYIDGFINDTSEAFTLNYNTLWPQYPYYDPDYLRRLYKQNVEDYAKWTDQYFQTAAIVDIEADMDLNVSLRVENLGNGLFRFNAGGIEVESVSVFDLKGTEVANRAEGDNTFRISAGNGMFVARAYLANGKQAVAKFKI